MIDFTQILEGVALTVMAGMFVTVWRLMARKQQELESRLHELEVRVATTNERLIDIRDKIDELGKFTLR